MEFTPRIQQILRIMLNSRGPVNKQDIADDIGVSKRTVQREFEYLELCIKKYGLKLENHKGKGVEIKGNPETIEKLREDLGDQQYPDAADRDGRRRRLLFELLRDRTPHKLVVRLDHFTGCRFALSCFSTERSGGTAVFTDFIKLR